MNNGHNLDKSPPREIAEAAVFGSLAGYIANYDRKNLASPA